MMSKPEKPFTPIRHPCPLGVMGPLFMVRTGVGRMFAATEDGAALGQGLSAFGKPWQKSCWLRTTN
jgi:hypothetical protein